MTFAEPEDTVTVSTTLEPERVHKGVKVCPASVIGLVPLVGTSEVAAGAVSRLTVTLEFTRPVNGTVTVDLVPVPLKKLVLMMRTRSGVPVEEKTP